MGGLWCPAWRSVALCVRRWSQPGWAGWTVAKSEPVLRPGWKGLGGAERGLRRLRTWERPSGVRGPAAQPPRRPRSSNPFQRAQEDEWRRRNKIVLTYVAAVAVGMLGASYAAVPLYRLYCQVGRDEVQDEALRGLCVRRPRFSVRSLCGSRCGQTCPGEGQFRERWSWCPASEGMSLSTGTGYSWLLVSREVRQAVSYLEVHGTPRPSKKIKKRLSNMSVVLRQK